MNVEFFEPMDKIPTVTAQQKGVNFKTKDPKKRFYKKPEIEALENRYKAMFLKNRPRRLLQGAIALKVVFRFPLTKGHREGEWKTTKPDTDNMLKLLKDCGTKILWKDDAQIVYEIVMKKYAKESGIVFQAYELDNLTQS